MSAERDFLELLVAAMLDAAIEGKTAQLQTSITPPGGRAKLVLPIIVPEEMDVVRSTPTGPFRRPE